MKYISVDFIIENAEQTEILVALLANAGFEGFEETDNSVKAFIKENEFNKIALEEAIDGLGFTYNLSIIEQQNWNAQWESSFEPVVINDFAAVRAGFHAPVRNVKHEIIITPKMSFGTGHHATTYLMMEQMSQIDFTNKTVFDFGTGTGVLAILAEKMGATNIYAIDVDDWSIENTLENVSTNNCKHIAAEKTDTLTAVKQYDIVLANINLNVLLSTMAAISSILLPGGIVLFSGILTADEAALMKAAAANKLVFSTVTEKKGWLCIKAHNIKAG